MQLMAILLLGFLAFPPMTFFVALYFQKLLRFSSLMTALHMLPMAVSGITMNVSTHITHLQRNRTDDYACLGYRRSHLAQNLQQAPHGHRRRRLHDSIYPRRGAAQRRLLLGICLSGPHTRGDWRRL